VGAITAGAAAPAGALTPSQERGKRIYLASSATRGPVSAVLGDAGVEIPGEALLCGDCHGRDGKGTLEGGVAASDIRREVLARPSIRSGPSGRERPAYDRESLRRALVSGADPAGRPLHLAMPRYRMEAADMEDLLDYLEVLGAERSPGVGDAELSLGAVLPRTGRLAEAGRAVEEVLGAFLEAANGRGGIHGRRLALKIADPSAGGPAAALADLERQGVFCLLGSLAGGEEEAAALEEAARARGVPLVGPVGLAARAEVPPNPYVFHLLPSVGDQVRALAAHALEDPAGGVALAAGENEAGLAARRAFASEMSLHGAGTAPVVPIPAAADLADGVVEALSGSRPASVLVVAGSEQVAAVSAALARAPWRPRVLSLAALAGGRILEAPPGEAARIVLAYPGPPPEEARGALAAFAGFLGEAKVRPRFVGFQIVALAAAQVLAEGLRRTGRDLTREGLVAELEKLHDFPTALAPGVGFGPNVRTGSRLVSLVRPDPASGRFVRVGPAPEAAGP
jgi:ABC-type branched-subunit amino acid transport system substrate-binding protein